MAYDKGIIRKIDNSNSGIVYYVDIEKGFTLSVNHELITPNSSKVLKLGDWLGINHRQFKVISAQIEKDVDQNPEQVSLGHQQRQGRQGKRKDEKRQGSGPIKLGVSGSHQYIFPFPRMPVGLKSRTRTKMMKGPNMERSRATYCAVKDSVTPITRAPRIAPGMFPMPPRTTTTKAINT